MVLKGSGDNFSGAGASAVYKDHDRTGYRGQIFFGIEPHLLTLHPPFGIHDKAFFDELIANLDRLIKQPAGIAAKIKHDPLERGLLCPDCLEGFPESSAAVS